MQRVAGVNTERLHGGRGLARSLGLGGARGRAKARGKARARDKCKVEKTRG